MSDEFIDPEVVGAQLERIMNNCMTRAAITMGMGAVGGFMFGVFFSTNQMPVMPGPDEPKIPLRVQMIEGLKASGKAGASTARNFAAAGAVFSGVECVVEKYRGVSDLNNGLYAGCLTGGALAYKGGAVSTLLGCAGFAAFSAVIDRFMQEEDPRDKMQRFDPYDPVYLAELEVDRQEELKRRAEAGLVANPDSLDEPEIRTVVIGQISGGEEAEAEEAIAPQSIAQETDQTNER